VAIGAAWAALAVVFGAFGAHGLAERLAASDHTAAWDTAARYHLVHALALILFGLLSDRWKLGAWAGRLLLAGSVLFSGSIYGLCLGFAPAALGPITPIGGLCLIAGWVVLAIGAWRRG